MTPDFTKSDLEAAVASTDVEYDVDIDLYHLMAEELLSRGLYYSEDKPSWRKMIEKVWKA